MEGTPDLHSVHGGVVTARVCCEGEGCSIGIAGVRLVAHLNLPKTLEGFYQESGRAGRDGLPSRSVLFYDVDDRERMDYILGETGSCIMSKYAHHVNLACRLQTHSFRGVASSKQQELSKWAFLVLCADPGHVFW